MILIIYAHPYPQHSHANKRMLEQVRTLDNVEIRSLYQLYPDFNIDIAAEQEALSRADLIIWQHPMQWYSTPALLKLWIDKVFSHGWAYGPGAAALQGKTAWWVASAGAAGTFAQPKVRQAKGPVTAPDVLAITSELAIMLRAGLALPYECGVGACGCCRCAGSKRP